MDFHFLVMEKSWKINVEKQGAPWIDIRRSLVYTETEMRRLTIADRSRVAIRVTKISGQSRGCGRPSKFRSHLV